MHHIHNKKAREQYDAAFHLLNVTFPLIKEPKLLMGIVNNVSQSMEHGMNAILAYERQLKLVPNYNNEFQSKFNLFRYKSIKRNNIPNELVTMMQDLKELIELHKQCPTEFQRGNKYILASKDYQLKVLSIKEIREYVAKNNRFLGIVNQILRI